MSAGHPLVVRGLTVRYGRDPVLDGVDLPDIRPGAITAFAGPNGAGKSTILKALAGLVPASGQAQRGEDDLLSMAPGLRAATLGFVPQTIPAADGLKDRYPPQPCVLR